MINHPLSDVMTGVFVSRFKLCSYCIFSGAPPDHLLKSLNLFLIFNYFGNLTVEFMLMRMSYEIYMIAAVATTTTTTTTVIATTTASTSIVVVVAVIILLLLIPLLQLN